MLVITRSWRDYVMVGDDLRITVERLDNRNVRLSFDGPESIKIWRGEIYEKIQKEAREQNGKAGE